MIGEYENIFEENYASLKKRFSRLATMIDGKLVNAISVSDAMDGGYCYSRIDEDGKSIFITDPVNPLANASHAVEIAKKNYLKKRGLIFIVGFAPGYELEPVLSFVSRDDQSWAGPQIYVIVDSIVHLIGWLKTSSHRELLEDKRIEFISKCEKHKICNVLEEHNTEEDNLTIVSSLEVDEIQKTFDDVLNIQILKLYGLMKS